MQTTAIVQSGPINIRLIHLIILYAIVPLALLIAVMDQFVWGRAILLASPFRPESWVIWVYFFGMPHVIGGMQMFADTEYLEKYGWRLGRILVACLLLPVVVGAVLGQQAMFLVFMSFIVYHTVAQQFGLTLVALKRPPDLFFYVWKWSTIGVAGVMYTMMYWVPFPIVLFDTWLREPLMSVAGLLLVSVALSAGLLMWKNRANGLGVLYVGANMALIVTEFYLFSAHYYFLVVIVGRIIHEFTAWPIYVAHEHNRNLVSTPNWIYRWFRGALPTAVLALVVAFAIGFALMYSTSIVPFMTSVVISLSIYHYYTEHFLWRRGGLLRNHVNFTR